MSQVLAREFGLKNELQRGHGGGPAVLVHTPILPPTPWIICIRMHAQPHLQMLVPHV